MSERYRFNFFTPRSVNIKRFPNPQAALNSSYSVIQIPPGELHITPSEGTPLIPEGKTLEGAPGSKVIVDELNLSAFQMRRSDIKLQNFEIFYFAPNRSLGETEPHLPGENEWNLPGAATMLDAGVGNGSDEFIQNQQLVGMYLHHAPRIAYSNFGGTVNTHVERCRFEFIGRGACIFNGARHSRIVNNRFHFTGDDSIALNRNSRSCVVSGNTIEYGGALGLVGANGINVSGFGNVITSNTLYRCFKGIQLKDVESGAEPASNTTGTTDYSIISNNTINQVTEPTGAEGNIVGFRIREGARCLIFGNIVLAFDAAGTARSPLELSRAVDIKFNNNLWLGSVNTVVNSVCRDIVFENDTFYRHRNAASENYYDTELFRIIALRNPDGIVFRRCDFDEESKVLFRLFNFAGIGSIELDDCRIAKPRFVAALSIDAQGNLTSGTNVTQLNLSGDTDLDPHRSDQVGVLGALSAGQRLALATRDGRQVHRQFITLASDLNPGDEIAEVVPFVTDRDYSGFETWLEYKANATSDMPDPDSFQSAVVYSDNPTNVDSIELRNDRTGYVGNGPSSEVVIGSLSV